ncbi:MAG: glycosyltransferase family 1 protein [Micavibrio sp.]
MDESLKILIVTDAWHPQTNGVVRTYENLAKALKAMGHSVRIVSPADFPHSFPLPGYSEIRLVRGAARCLREIVESFAPDLFHIGTEGPLGLAARRYAQRRGLRFTSCYHTHFPDYAAKRAARLIPFMGPPVRKIGILYLRWFHKASSCLFSATPSLDAHLEKQGFTCPVRRLTRGIDESIFYPGAPLLWRDLKRPVALYAGRVAIEKNLEDFLDMDWAGSKVIVGDGPARERLQQRYPGAVFTGKKSGQDLADHYRSADIFVFPSRTDTFGMVLIEAMACGLPIAGYPVTGPMDIVTDEFLGAVDDDLATAAIKAIAYDAPDAREERALHAKEYYSWSLAARQFISVD